MKLQIESTADIVELIPGLRTRAWHGTAENGINCMVFVAAVGVPEVPGWKAFQRELDELPHPGRRADIIMATKLLGTPGPDLTLEHFAIALFAAHGMGESLSVDDAESRWGHLEPEAREAWRMTADLARLLLTSTHEATAP